MKINEEEANDFARQYLFSDEKMKTIKPRINDPRIVKYFAEQNHVHPSIIYTFYCWDAGEGDSSYAKYHKQMIATDFDELLARYEAKEFLNFVPIKQITTKRNAKLLNTI
jgi:hypothetical protein